MQRQFGAQDRRLAEACIRSSCTGQSTRASKPLHVSWRSRGRVSAIGLYYMTVSFAAESSEFQTVAGGFVDGPSRPRNSHCKDCNGAKLN